MLHLQLTEMLMHSLPQPVPGGPSLCSSLHLESARVLHTLEWEITIYTTNEKRPFDTLTEFEIMGGL